LSQGAPLGNQNAKKGKAWADAVRRAIREKYDGEDYEAKLAQLAKRLIEAADGGDMAALKEVGDRLDGKPTQQTELSGPDGQTIPMQTIVNFVTPGAGTS
jgi:hypothetical protein